MDDGGEVVLKSFIFMEELLISIVEKYGNLNLYSTHSSVTSVSRRVAGNSIDN
jgi:hypothetical protein